MKPLIVVLAAAAITGTAQARPSRAPASYEAGGFEPSWVVRMDRRRLVFDPGTTQPGFTVPLPRRQPTRRGYRMVMPGLVVDVRHEPCSSYDGRDFPDTVYAFFNGSNHDGCGGVSIPPRRLAGTDWSVGYLDNRRVPDPPENYAIHFNDGGHFVIQSPCVKYEGSYRERRPGLEIANLARTWTGCDRYPLAPRILEILREPMRCGYPTATISI